MTELQQLEARVSQAWADLVAATDPSVAAAARARYRRAKKKLAEANNASRRY